MNSATLLQVNGASPSPRPSSWAALSVKDFFGAINWENRAPDLQLVNLGSSPQGSGNQPLSMLLSVSQFFNAVNWEGAAIAAAPSIQDSAATPKDDTGNLTLEDFFTAF
jgi:hypothetical protein